MEKENVLLEKTMDFAVRIVKLSRYLQDEMQEYVLSKQILRCGTSIGANAKEACSGQSLKDFISKLSISLKEASETEYWLELLFKTGYLSEKEYGSLQLDCQELIKILVSILKTSKKRDKDFH